MMSSNQNDSHVDKNASDTSPFDQGPVDQGLVTASLVDQGTVHKNQSVGGAPCNNVLAQFDGVSKWYRSVMAVNGVSIDLNPGITGLVGANGAGKTSFIRLLTGQIKPSLGSVKIAGFDAWGSRAKMHVGYCPDVDVFYEEMSGFDFVRLIGRYHGLSHAPARRRCEEVLAEVGMLERADRPLRTYSKGMRQRIKLAQALIHSPDLIVLDEPLNGVDPIGRRDLIELFRQLADQGKAVLVSSHNLEEMDKLADRVLFMSRSRLLASGSLDQVRELLSDFPQKILIRSDRIREFASLLMKLEGVLGASLEGDRGVHLEVKHPARFFDVLQEIIVEHRFEIELVRITDASSESVFRYLVERARRFWIRGETQ